MNATFFIFHDAQDRYRRSGGYEGTHIDRIYINEISDLIREHHSNIFHIYSQLTYMYVRYTSTNLHYSEIPAFVENSNENPTLYLITHLRSVLAYNMIDFYEAFMTDSISIISAASKENRIHKGNILNLLRNFKPSTTPEEKIVDLNISLCEFAEYVNYLKLIVDSQKVSDDDLEFLISTSTYFGYITRSDSYKWEDCSSLLIKLFNSYTSDFNRSDGFLYFIGYFIYELFRNNPSFPKKYLKDINLWVLGGYKFKLEEMSKDYDDVWESIQREEYSELLLNKCEDNLKIAWKIYKSFIMLNWTVNTVTTKYAEKVIHVHEDAIRKIRSFKD